MVPDHMNRSRISSGTADKDGWFTAKVRYVYLRSGRLNQTLQFVPPATKVWKKKVEWAIEDSGRHARVEYTLDGPKGRLSRRLAVGQDTRDVRETRVEAESQTRSGVISVQVRLDGPKIQIFNDKGNLLDEYTPADFDLSKTQIRIRTEAQFVVRSNNE